MEKLSSAQLQGQRIKVARKLTLLSRSAFSRKYNINPSALQAWEEGRYKKGLQLNKAKLLADAFSFEHIQCSTEWLLYGVGEKPKRSALISIPTSLKSQKCGDLYKIVAEKAYIKRLNFQLIEAIKDNSASKVLRLIREGANLYQLKGTELYLYGGRKDTALHLAAMFSTEVIIKIFIDLGVHPNIRNRHMDTPLHLAVYENNIRAVESLIRFGADIEASSREGTPPLSWAAYLGNISACELLLKYHADINNTDINGNSVMHWACYNNQVATIKYLYEKGAIPDKKNHEGKLPLDWVIANGNTEALDTLVDICGIKESNK